jgi:hypothetical protein
MHIGVIHLLEEPRWVETSPHGLSVNFTVVLLHVGRRGTGAVEVVSDATAADDDAAVVVVIGSFFLALHNE